MAFEVLVVVVLTLPNGFFATSETATVSAPKARLRERDEGGDRGALAALGLAESSNRLLSAV